ncbi:MAG TPA: nitrate- and nitrite sensing domain-containing protein [Trebonia sp.]|nr:nitrate- and nitrite sensing domain-containing protein [Trebonia sp.]
MLVIPLISLVALWAYAASSTVGGALAKRSADTVNSTIGGLLQGLVQQLDTERSDTFVWQSARGLLPRTTLDAQRAATDKAVAAFRAGAARVTGQLPAAAKSLDPAVLASLNQLAVIRTETDTGKIAPLTAFLDYNGVVDAFYPFTAALTNPQESFALIEEGTGVLDEGEALEDVAEEAALAGGALAFGGTMSATEHRVFTQTVDSQRLLDRLGESPVYWEQAPDPYPAVYASPAFAAFQALEDKIVAAAPGTRLPVSVTAWQAGVGSAITELTATETAVRLNITKGQAHAGDIILLRLILVGGAGLVAVIVSSILLLGFGNRISRELTGLRGAARMLAGERLPSVVSRLRAGDEVDVAAEAPPLDLGTRTREVTETAEAFSVVQRTAVQAAVDQARLRNGVSLVFRSLARRNQSLLQRQLKLLDEMEKGAEDPDALEQLFRLDHLTTRMRRQAEGLIILSGALPGRAWRQPVPVVEVLRGATGEIEDYARVDLLTDSPDFVQGTAVADVTHILAELVENAVLYSAPGTRVQVRGGRVANGYVIEVEDRGLGIPSDTMDALNERLARPPEFDLADSDQLGLFVVSRLAARHGVRVSLRLSGYGGTIAIVLLPPDLVVAEEQVSFLAGRAGHAGPAGQAAAAAATAEAVTRGAGLPHRQRMASIAPQLRENRPGVPSGPPAGGSPEQARALMSAIQRGWRSGRGTSVTAHGDENTDTGGGRH